MTRVLQIARADGKNGRTKARANARRQRRMEYDRKLIACWRKVDRLLAELGDAVRQARNFPAGRVLMNDAPLGRPHDDWLGICERRLGAATVACGDGLLDLDH